jgi:hypothetical protein
VPVATTLFPRKRPSLVLCFVSSSFVKEDPMTDIRRTILWVIFGFSMVLLWDQWQLHNGKKATFFPKPEVAATVPAPPLGPRPRQRLQRLPKPMLCLQRLPQ